MLDKIRVFIERRLKNHCKANREYWENANFFQKLKVLNELFLLNAGLLHEDGDRYVSKKEFENIKKRYQ